MPNFAINFLVAIFYYAYRFGTIGMTVYCVMAMPVGTLNIPRFEKNKMGQVTATITITNDVDKILADRGFIKPEEVRSVTLEDVLVDTGASMLSLPTPIAEELGLSVKGLTSLKTAAGSVKARIFSHALLEVNGRSSTFDCMELTEIDIPLLGVLPMETLGLEPDLKNQRLRMLGAEDGDSYIYAM